MDVDGSGSVEFPEFCIMMVKKMRDSDTENEVCSRPNLSIMRRIVCAMYRQSHRVNPNPCPISCFNEIFWRGIRDTF